MPNNLSSPWPCCQNNPTEVSLLRSTDTCHQTNPETKQARPLNDCHTYRINPECSAIHKTHVIQAFVHCISGHTAHRLQTKHTWSMLSSRQQVVFLWKRRGCDGDESVSNCQGANWVDHSLHWCNCNQGRCNIEPLHAKHLSVWSCRTHLHTSSLLKCQACAACRMVGWWGMTI